MKNIEKENLKKTKSLIIDCAGKLIAQYGFSKVTSKKICEEANINLAAINYHFGSRENLYIEVLKEVHQYLINIDELNKISLSSLTPKEKIETFIDIFVADSFNENNWHIKVWAREVINPSPYINQILSLEIFPKLKIVAKIFGEYTGLPVTDQRLYSCILNTMAPFILSFLVYKSGEPLPIRYPLKDLVSHLKKFIFAGLDEFKNNKD